MDGPGGRCAEVPCAAGSACVLGAYRLKGVQADARVGPLARRVHVVVTCPVAQVSPVDFLAVTEAGHFFLAAKQARRLTVACLRTPETQRRFSQLYWPQQLSQGHPHVSRPSRTEEAHQHITTAIRKPLRGTRHLLP